MGKKKKKQNKNSEPQEEMDELLEKEAEEALDKVLEEREEQTWQEDESYFDGYRDEDQAAPEGEPFDPEKHGVPGLDELAIRLQVPPVQGADRGIVMWSKSGRAYSWVDLLAAHLEFTSQATIYNSNTSQKVEQLLEKVKEEMKNELNQRSR